MFEILILFAVIIGFLKGFIDNKSSFWKGFGEGIVSSKELNAKTSLYCFDRKTGIGMKIEYDNKNEEQKLH